MIKQTHLKTPLVIAFVALMLTVPTANLNAGPMDGNQTDGKGSNQSEAPRLMAQVTEERRSVTSSTSSTTEAPPPTEEYRSVTSSTSSTSSTSEAPPPTEERRSVTSSTSSTKEAPVQKPNCADQCRGQFDRSMSECNLPDHPDRKDCEEWAGEREKECLEKCYRK